MTDIDLINWTIEEAIQLKVERLQPSNLDLISSLEQILIWPKDGPSELPKLPVDSDAKMAHSSAEPVRVLPPFNDAAAGLKPETASREPFAVSVSFSTSAARRSEEPKLPLPTAIIKAEVHAARVEGDREIGLRWVLRDIRSNRLKWWPLDQRDLQTLIGMGLVEVSEGMPVLTIKGNDAIY
jgi:hypothetical protein